MSKELNLQIIYIFPGMYGKKKKAFILKMYPKARNGAGKILASVLLQQFRR